MLAMSKQRRRRSGAQAELNFDVGRHGGRREGAGRPEGPNPRLWHRSRDDFSPSHPSLVTLKVRRGIGSIRRWRVVRAIEASFRRACARAGFRLIHYSIQRDHVHLIVEAEDRHALGRAMKSIAARLAVAINKALGRKGRVLADRYHQSVLRCPRQVRNALAYVLLNARRHAAKRRVRLAFASVLDAASSARWFDGWRPDVALDRSPPHPLDTAPAVARPTLWLLTQGWRRHGLIDPNEIPGPAR
jgi:REP element-mobilizing transposase RayT